MPHFEVTVSDTNYYYVIVEAADFVEAEQLAPSMREEWVPAENLKSERTMVAAVESDKYTPGSQITRPSILPPGQS